MGSDDMPGRWRVRITVRGANRAADVLGVDDDARGTEASCNRSLLKHVDFDVGGVERFVLDCRRLDDRDPLRFVYLLTVRKRAGEVIAVDALKVSAAV